MKKEVLMLSGGLDSAAAWWALGKPPWLFVTKANRKEVESKELRAVLSMMAYCQEFAERGRIVDCDFSPFRSQNHSVFPREFLLACIAVAEGFNTIYFIWHTNDSDPERREQVVKDITRLLRENYLDQSLTVLMPFKDFSREELVRKALEAGCPKEFLLVTWSCQSGGDLHCGYCDNCVERWIALRNNGIDATYQFMNNPEDGLLQRGIRDLRTHPEFLTEYRKVKNIPEGEIILI